MTEEDRDQLYPQGASDDAEEMRAQIAELEQKLAAEIERRKNAEAVVAIIRKELRETFDAYQALQEGEVPAPVRRIVPAELPEDPAPAPFVESVTNATGMVLRRDEKPDEGHPRVLVVEDNRLIQRTLTQLLTGWGYRVECENDGRCALDRVKETAYLFALIDCQMPHLDGYQATKMIRQFERDRRGRLTIIGMSAHVDVDSRERCLEEGMDDYLSKPILPEVLLACIERVKKRLT